MLPAVAGAASVVSGAANVAAMPFRAAGRVTSSLFEVNKIRVDAKTILMVVGVLIFIFFIYFILPAKIKRIFRFRIRVPDVNFVQGDGSVDIEGRGSYYLSLVQKMNYQLEREYSVLWKVPDPVSVTARCAVFGEWINNLNLNEFRYMTNVYKNTYKVTIREHIAEIAMTGCWGRDYVDEFKKRLDGLGIP